MTDAMPPVAPSLDEKALSAVPALEPAVGVPRRSSMWRRYRRNKLAVGGLVFVVILVIAAVFAPWVSPYDETEQNLTDSLAPPSWHHWLGTDEYGRDLLSRLIVGSQVSLMVGVASVLLVLLVGVSIGLLAGNSRRLDGPLMRLVDMVMAIPEFFLLLLLVSLFGTGTLKLVLYIGLSAWMATARLVRGQVLALREREFVLASHTMGARTWWIITRHLLRNVLDVITVQATLSISLVILLESGLSYLGLGAQPPTPSWGNILANGKDYMLDAWWITLFPGMAIFLTVIAFNFIGDGLRDALDVRL